MSVAPEGGLVTTFSERFTLTGMTGSTLPAYVTAATAAGDKVPAMVDGTANDVAANPAAGDAANGNSGIPFASQTGLMRYAPMQSVPPTKITKKDTKPLYPTSSVKIATAFLPTPSATKTQTASQTFSADSMENTVRHDIWSHSCLNREHPANVKIGIPRAWSRWRHAEVPDALEGLDAQLASVRLCESKANTCHGLMVHVCCMYRRSGHGTSLVWLGFAKHDFGAWGIYKICVDTSAPVIQDSLRDDCSGLKAMPTECA
jgi:hypothetical protein